MENFLNITRWNVRITSEEDIEFIKQVTEQLVQKYIIGTELSQKGKLHYHIYMEGDIKDKEQIKKVLNANKIIGNKGWYAKEADNSSKVKKYCMKDKNFIHKNIDESLIETWKKGAHMKARDGMGEKLNQLEDRFHNPKGMTMSQQILGKEYLKICAEFNYKQGITKPKMNQYINYHSIRRNPEKHTSYLVSLWIDN